MLRHSCKVLQHFYYVMQARFFCTSPPLFNTADDFLKHSCQTRVCLTFLALFIFKLSIIYGLTSYFCSVCELQVEREFLDAFWIRGWKCIKLAGTSRRSKVATSPRRDVLTSRRWVNKFRSQQAATSRCLNVATSARFLPLHH